MHLKRWITGLAAVPFLVYIIVSGGVVFSCFIGLIALIALWEYFRIVFPGRRDLSVHLMMGAGYLFATLITVAAHRHDVQFIPNLLMLNFLAAGCLAVFRFGSDASSFESAKKQSLGILYVPFLLSYLILVRHGSAVEGSKWIFFLLAIVFAGDIGALYAGTFLGKHKLIPTVSPKKTIEGSLGGITANILIGSCYKALFMPHLAWGTCLLLFVLLGTAGQMGDLFESGLKRVAKVKDSGVLLPGHGGILDRADAIMFAAPVAYMFKEYLFSR